MIKHLKGKRDYKEVKTGQKQHHERGETEDLVMELVSSMNGVRGRRKRSQEIKEVRVVMWGNEAIF